MDPASVLKHNQFLSIIIIFQMTTAPIIRQ
jgi:hypothetical protein